MITNTSDVLKCEQKLIDAYKSNNTEIISTIYHDNLIFNSPDGRTMTRIDDIESLKSGVLTIYEYNPSNNLINLIDDVAVVSVSIHIKGKIAGNAFEHDFKFLRVWKRVEAEWKLIAISGLQVK